MDQLLTLKARFKMFSAKNNYLKFLDLRQYLQSGYCSFDRVVFIYKGNNCLKKTAFLQVWTRKSPSHKNKVAKAYPASPNSSFGL